MYDLIYDIIGHEFQSGTGFNTTEQQIYMYVCGALIIVITVTFIDLIYRVFRHFWR